MVQGRGGDEEDTTHLGPHTHSPPPDHTFSLLSQTEGIEQGSLYQAFSNTEPIIISSRKVKRQGKIETGWVVSLHNQK